jgi:hypothetical protein
VGKNEYRVGYGKPPEWSRYKKGQSGNPKGRPRKVKNLATMVKEILDEEVTLRRNGEPVARMSRKQATILSLANKAMSGDVKAAGFFFPKINELNSAEIELLEQTRKMEEQQNYQLRVLRVMTPNERKILKDLFSEAEDRLKKDVSKSD